MVRSATIRDRLLRRKACVLAVYGLCFFAMVLALPVAVRWPSFSGETHLAIAVVGTVVVCLCLFFASRGVRCPRCGYNLTKLSLRRQEKLQVNVCGHCCLSLDAPPEAGRPA